MSWQSLIFESLNWHKKEDLLEKKYFPGSMPLFTTNHSYIACGGPEVFTSTTVFNKCDVELALKGGNARSWKPIWSSPTNNPGRLFSAAACDARDVDRRLKPGNITDNWLCHDPLHVLTVSPVNVNNVWQLREIFCYSKNVYVIFSQFQYMWLSENSCILCYWPYL